MAERLHITGASGSGTSTLARALADRLSSQAFDTDDFYWVPTDPPFLEKRPVAERLRLMEEMFLPRGHWILSGSLHSWGAPAMERVTAVIFLTAPRAQRIARLRARERRRLGDRIAPGGDMQAQHVQFLNWAAAYDDDGTIGRSRTVHEAWLATLSCPVIRLAATDPAPQLADRALAMLDAPVPAA